jgi:predicted transcriptional regulator
MASVFRMERIRKPGTMLGVTNNSVSQYFRFRRNNQIHGLHVMEVIEIELHPYNMNSKS